jgi:hypothetical protein
MANIISDYFAMLRSDYVAPKKDEYHYSRRPYNRDIADNFQFIPAVVFPLPVPSGIKLIGFTTEDKQV